MPFGDGTKHKTEVSSKLTVIATATIEALHGLDCETHNIRSS